MAGRALLAGWFLAPARRSLDGSGACRYVGELSADPSTGSGGCPIDRVTYYGHLPEGKTAKNRVHVDIRASAGPGDEGRERARQHAQRLVDARATVLHEKHEPIGSCIVMTDTEGNEFCVT
jgi:hypothetical protein